MSTARDCTNRPLSLLSVVLALALATSFAAPVWGQAPCTLPDNGTGTVDLPPPGCGYVSPQDLHRIIAGLPPGTEIRVGAQHHEFFGVTSMPGGSLGGEIEMFGSHLMLNLQGTGALGGFQRTINLQANVETHIGPRVLGTPVQSFDTEMFMLDGQLPPGDPDFDLLRITAGTDAGLPLPSPGHTTLTQLPGGDWNVDSFFDIFYQIDYVGAPGGPLGGMSGSTTGTIRMQSGTPAPNPPPCVVPDDGTGTVSLPPPGCGYVSPDDLHQMINGLPPGTVIEVAAEHDRFFNVQTNPGGSLGGEVETFVSDLTLHLSGAGLDKTVVIPTNCETHTGPRTPGEPVQSFDTEMFRIQGALPPGDPDFDLLRVRAGSFFGLPSPGHTTLTQLVGGSWNVDSFFDITYQIEFVGAPGGPLAGMSGTTTATIKMQTGQPETTLPTCFNPDNGSGTVNLPPAGCGYLSPDDVHRILQGLPAGTQVNLGAQHARFFNVQRMPGGPLGGEIEQFGSFLELHLEGEDILPGFSRILSLPVQCVTHTGPRVPGTSPQVFPNDMFRLEGQLPPGDPDFDLLRVTGGTFFGMPSPGHTTLTQQPGGNWAVDSFFDVFYEIEFVGSPTGHLGGMSGSTTGTIRMSAAPQLSPPVGTPSLTLTKTPQNVALLDWSPVPNATSYDVVCGDLGTLRSSSGDFSMATTTCLQDDLVSTSAPLADVPPEGECMWCTVRGGNLVGLGTHNEGGAQIGTRDGEILNSGLACP